MRQQSWCTFIFLFLSISVFWNFTILPAIFAKTLIKTSDGLIEVENLNVGDKVTSFDPDSDSFIEAKITKISKKTSDTIVIIETDQGIVCAPGDQLFFDPELEQWIEAKDLTTDNILIDCDFYEIQCFNIEHLNFPVTIYEITVEDPHVLFVSEYQVLSHNFFPLAAPVIFTFGSGAAASAASSAGTAAVAGGLGALLAHLFGGKNNGYYHPRSREAYFYKEMLAQKAQNKALTNFKTQNPPIASLPFCNQKLNRTGDQQANRPRMSNQILTKNCDIIKNNDKMYIKPKYMSASKCIKSFQKPKSLRINWKKHLDKKRIRKNKKAQKYRNKQKKRNEQKKKNKSNTSKNPKKPDDDEDKRKTNKISCTEFFHRADIKKDYKFYKNTSRGKVYRRKPGAKGLGKKAEYIQWDHTHNDVEVYNKAENHIGCYDPATNNLYKPPVSGRRLPD